MSYKDVWIEKMKLNGTNSTQAMKNKTDAYYVRHFKENQSYRRAKYKENNKEELEKDIRVINEDNDFDKKKVYLLPNDFLNCGDYLYFDDYWWIVGEFNPNLESPVGKVDKCNQMLKWKDENGIHEYPCILANDGYGVKTNATNDIQNAISAKSKIKVQYNDYTKTIESDYRFCFNHSKSDIFKVLDLTTSMTDGIITITCEKTEYREIDDDLENNLACIDKLNNSNENKPTEPEIPSNYTIEGVDKFKQKTNATFTINPLVDCTFGFDKIDTECNTATIISQSDGSCVVYGNQLYASSPFTLRAYVDEKEIANKEITVTKN